MAEKKPNGWDEWKNYVLTKTEENGEKIESLEATVNKSTLKITAEIATLKVKSGIWGAIGGLVPVVILIGLAFIGYLMRVI